MVADKGAGLVARLLEVIERHIVPLTRDGVGRGDKVFGAAILRKSDGALVVAGTNHETANPLWHGEVHTLKAFYELPAEQRPATRDCLFLATHEPCPLCLSAITWTGFDNFYYLFGYADTADAFQIPHDLRILEEVFRVRGGAYARQNAYWQSHALRDMIEDLPIEQRTAFQADIHALEQTYRELSETYQATKGETAIPLS